MKIYNKKGFIKGLICLFISLFGIVSIVMRGFATNVLGLTTLIFLCAVTDISRSLSKPSTFEDIIMETDEREQYILLKSANKTLQILEGVFFLTTIALMVAYSVTNNRVLLVAFICSSGYITITFIIRFATNRYYEKNN